MIAQHNDRIIIGGPNEGIEPAANWLGDLPRYRLAILGEPLDGKLPAGDPRWEKLADGWICTEGTQWDIAAWIGGGFPWCAWMDGRRRSDNFMAGQLIGVDFDEMSPAYKTLPELARHPFIAKYGLLLYHTPSSTPEDPRVRVVFGLDQPIESAKGYEAAARMVLSLFPWADQSTKDAARFFYGAHGSEPVVLGRQLPLAVLRTQYRQELELQRRKQKVARGKAKRYDKGRASDPLTADGFQEKVSEITQRLATMSQGSRNNELNSAAYWVAGVDVPEDVKAEAMRALRDAALAAGLSERETDRTLRSATNRSL